MLDLGAAGYSILAVSAVAGIAVVGFILVIYASHCFLAIVVDSGCGIDEIRWPHEGVVDWLVKPVYLAWLHLPWGVLFGVVLLPLFVGDAVTYFITLGCILFVLFPITLLSSLSAKSWLALLYPAFLRRWLRWPLTFLLVLLWSLPLPLAAWRLVELTMGRGFWWVFAAALVGPLALLFGARLLGRYGWLVTHTPLKDSGSQPSSGTVTGVRVEDPWAGPPPSPRPQPPRTDANEARALRMKLLPAEALEMLDDDALEDDLAPAAKPQEVRSEKQARESGPQRAEKPPERVEPYRLSEAPTLSTPFAAPAQSAERRHTPPAEQPTFAQAFGAGLFGFPLYGESIRAWANLAVLTLALLGCVRVLLIAIAEIGRLQ